MKKLFIFFTIVIRVNLVAQQNDFKRDNVWMMGQDCNTDTAFNSQFYSVFYMDFNSSVPILRHSCPNIFAFDFNRTGICDTSGNLIMHTNGMELWDGNGHRLDSVGLDFEHFRIGRRSPMSSLILPMPNNLNEYIFLNIPITQNCALCNYYSEKLYETRIMYDGANYSLPLRNHLLFNDTFAFGVTACRHANGRDWWIIAPAWNSNNYFKFILDPNGLRYVGQQQVGQRYLGWNFEQMCFSPDGTKYVRAETVISSSYISGGTRIDLFDFDRCTGDFTFQSNWYRPREGQSAGAAFSRNSRFAYVSTDSFVVQIDTRNANPTADTIARYSGLVDTIWYTPQILALPAIYVMMQLAPDDKIYVSSNPIKFLHVIENPDLPYPACNFRDKGFSMGIINHYGLPNYPHFRLGRLEGSSCDTIYSNVTEIDDGGVKVYPNPATNVLTIETTKSIGVIEIFDVLGRPVSLIQLQSSISTLDISEYARGVYLVKVTDEGGQFVVKKIVVE